MKALSIRQPWAWAIVTGHKPVENRTWATTTRGTILIHAAKKMTADDYMQGEFVAQLNGVTIPPKNELERGGIVGQATITDCVTEIESGWFFGPFGFVLADAKPLAFRPCKGRLGFFNVERKP